MPEPLLPHCLPACCDAEGTASVVGSRRSAAGLPIGKAIPLGSVAFCTNDLDLQTRGEKEQSTTGMAMPTRRVGGQEPETCWVLQLNPPGRVSQSP